MHRKYIRFEEYLSLNIEVDCYVLLTEEDKWKDNFRPDGKRWACPYCSKCIEGSFEMMAHIEKEHPGIVQHRVIELE